MDQVPHTAISLLGGEMPIDHIYVGEAIKLTPIKDKRTFYKYVKKNVFKIVGKDALGHLLFSRKQVIKAATLIRKNAGKGYPLIISSK